MTDTADRARTLADLCERSLGYCGNGLYDEVVRLRAENTRLELVLCDYNEALEQIEELKAHIRQTSGGHQ